MKMSCLRTYAVDDHKKQVYIKLKELYWTLWRLIGRKRSWAEGRQKSRSIHCELPRLTNEDAAAALESCFLITKLNVIRTPISTDRGPLGARLIGFQNHGHFPHRWALFLSSRSLAAFWSRPSARAGRPPLPRPNKCN